MADDNTPSALTQEHADYLAAHAVDVTLAERLGVRSLISREDNPQEGVWPNWSNHPAILFPWTSEDGRVEYQVRPDDPTTDQRSGKPRKYIFARDMTPVLWAVRPSAGAERIVIVEGTKQCLAAASYAPPGVAVYGIAGCRMWQLNGKPIRDLRVADGREVVVILDADASTNPEVYDAGLGLAEALSMEGAARIVFGRLPGGAAKSGLDDILAGREPDNRASYLARIISNAKPKPADARPRPRRRTGGAPAGEGERKTIVVNRDRFAVINDLSGAMVDLWNGRELFCHGGVISRRVGDLMTPVDRGTFHDLVQATAITVNENEGAQGTTYSFAWPDSGTMSATMSRADRFAPLDRITHAPFVRPDGSIVVEPGYDEITRTLLMPDEIFAGIEVPENPADDDIASARKLIMEEWLGDFPLDTDADRANLLALVVTPAIRGMVPRAPMAVVDGLQMGVGKNLLADCLLTVYTGHAAQPMNWVTEPEELRKQITSAFRTGVEFFVFDEAHTLDGAPLAQALTAETWQDRILGVSTMANFPNRVTWISLGNNVQVKGDITRRVYRIAIRPRYANPQDRKADTFRHPGISGLDLGSWTRKHRRDLMVAILVLVRAWFAQGQPYPKRGVSFGSFEAWERTVGGIVETAGLEGFLGNLKVWRSESDFDTQYWISHLMWLREQFGERSFRTAEVKAKAITLGLDLYDAPPRLDDPTEKAYGKALGEAYSRISGRRYGPVWLERVGNAHGHVSVYQVFSGDDLPPAPPVVPEPEPDPQPVDIPGTDAEPVGQIGPVQESEVMPGKTDIPEVDLLDLGEEPTSLVRGGPGYALIDNPHVVVPLPAPGGEVLADAGHDEMQAPHWTDLIPDNLSVERGGLQYPTADVVTFDLEAGDANDLYRTPGDSYIRLGGTAGDDGEVVPYAEDVPRAVAADLRLGRAVTGHNIMAFDLPALVRAGVLSMPKVHEMAANGRLFDTILAARYLDPPMARDKGVDEKRKYDLGALGAKYQLGEKLTDTSKALVKKYGGWDKVPIDDSEDGRLFKAYMVQDVELSRKLHARLSGELERLGPAALAYVEREHRVAALATQISMNGFLVNPVLLAERIAGIEKRKAEAMTTLAGEYGVPISDAKGKAYKSPLSSKVGKAALEAALVAAGVPDRALWRTATAGDLQISAEAMLHYGREYHHRPGVVAIAKAVYRIVSARTVYETIHNATGPDGRVHPKIGFDQATGRWSLTSPGLTVLGKRGGRHVERAVLLPDPREVLISFDLSQVDMRAVAGLSQDKAYIEMLEHEDPHAEIALALFGDRKMREVAKPIGHGWNYGRSIQAISNGEGIDPALVVQFDRSMRDRFGRLVEWREEIRALAASGQLLDNGFGRPMRPDPTRSHTQGPALMGQGAARDIMMTGMLRLPAECLPMLRAQVHDEIVLSVPVDQVEDVRRAVIDALSFEWKGVPILADGSPAGTDWSKCYEKAG